MTKIDEIQNVIKDKSTSQVLKGQNFSPGLLMFEKG
jgi:hypothetical protein